MTKKIVALVFFLFLFSFASATVCGNDSCETGENMCSCPTDCGQCSGDAPGICKYYQCVDSSCEILTKSGCCGNSQCEFGEDYGNCPADCRPSEVTVELLSPDTTDYFVRGENVVFKAKITSHGRKAILAEALLSADFLDKSIPLFNDGKHGDANAFDDVFANSLFIPTSLEPGLQQFTLDVNFFDVFKDLQFDLNVSPVLDVYLVLKPVYFLGDNIALNIETRRKGTLVSLPVKASIFGPDQELLFSQELESATGIYSTGFHSSLLEKPGLWTVLVQGFDDSNNTAFFRQTISVLEPGQAEYLTIQSLEPLQEDFVRGSEIPVKVSVSQNNQPVSQAAVKVITALREELLLEESEAEPGTYLGKFKLGYNFPAGRQRLKVSASKMMEDVQFSGSANVDLNVQPAALTFEVLAPTHRVFRAGEEVVLRLALSYPNQEKASHALIETTFNNSQIKFLEVEPGIYEAVFSAQAAQLGQHSLELTASDPFGNSGKTKFAFEISGFALLVELQRALPFIFIILIAVLAAVSLGSKFYAKKSGQGRLKAQEKQLLALQRGLQKDYFEKNILSKKEFNALHREYQTKLKKVRAQLKEWRKK